MRSKMNDGSDSYDVQVDWARVLPLGDTLCVKVDGGIDRRWMEAFAVVLGEYTRQTTDQEWGTIDFEYASDEDEPRCVLFMRHIQPEAGSAEVRRTLDDLVDGANTVAEVGTHVYELARELREAPAAATPQGSVPPPTFDPLEDELDANAA
jgi:quinol monooxygenase YgiN